MTDSVFHYASGKWELLPVIPDALFAQIAQLADATPDGCLYHYDARRGWRCVIVQGLELLPPIAAGRPVAGDGTCSS